MKSLLIALAGLILSLPAYAQPDELYFDDDGYYDEYFDRDYDDVYKYGFRINNYAGPYAEQFVADIARQYGVPRSVLRSYIRQGFAPSDLLFGLELSARSGAPLRQVMDSYYRSPDRNWITVSVDLGIGRASVGFRHIVDRFRYHCGYWNNYYVRLNPRHIHPPVYAHPWSYFRPHAPHHAHRPQPPHRPPHVQPGPPPRPHPRPEAPHRPQPPHMERPRPSDGSYRREPSARPSSPARPSRPSQSERPSRPSGNERPDGRPSTQERPQGGNSSQYRRESGSSSRTESSGRDTRPEAETSRPSSGGGYRR